MREGGRGRGREGTREGTREGGDEGGGMTCSSKYGLPMLSRQWCALSAEINPRDEEQMLLERVEANTGTESLSTAKKNQSNQRASLAELFLATTNHIIMVVTFTNHALDDFLESLLDNGVTNIVRIGGRCRSDRISEYNLRELGRSGKAPFSREHTRRYAQLKQTIEEAEKDVMRLVPIISREIGEKWWARIEPFLKDYHQTSWEQ